jgi:hypothetical protein
VSQITYSTPEVDDHRDCMSGRDPVAALLDEESTESKRPDVKRAPIKNQADVSDQYRKLDTRSSIPAIQFKFIRSPLDCNQSNKSWIPRRKYKWQKQ